MPNVTVYVEASDALSPDNLIVQLKYTPDERQAVVVSEALPMINGNTTTRLGNATVTLQDGTYKFEARATDGAGNVGPVASVVVTVDMLAPRVSPWRTVTFANSSSTEVCTAVMDASASDCYVQSWQQQLPISGPPTTLPFSLTTGHSEVAPASLFCGSVVWGTYQGNLSMIVNATDPAGNSGFLSLWTVHDSVPPTHVAALDLRAANGVCVGDSGVVVCRTGTALLLNGSCTSGGPPSIPSAPCAVEWAVATHCVLVQASCVTSSSSNATAPVGPWASLPHGSFTLNVSSEVEFAASSSGGSRLAVEVAVWTRALDDAGDECGCPD